MTEARYKELECKVKKASTENIQLLRVLLDNNRFDDSEKWMQVIELVNRFMTLFSSRSEEQTS